MRSRSVALGCLLGVLLALPVAASGQHESPSVTGIVSVKGNEPAVYLALTDDQGQDWKLTGPLAPELDQAHQNQRVKVYVAAVPPVVNRLVPPELKVIRFEVIR